MARDTAAALGPAWREDPDQIFVIVKLDAWSDGSRQAEAGMGS
jgi:hypothetical protein